MQLGQESAAQVRKQMTIVNDPSPKNYVLSGKRLTASQQAQAERLPVYLRRYRRPRSTRSLSRVGRCSSIPAC